jgi:hypothetical protein
MVETWQDAVMYIGRAVKWGGYSPTDEWDLNELPMILEAYDVVETLSTPEVEVVSGTVKMIYGAVK